VSAAAAAGNIVGLFAAAAERRGRAPAIVDVDGRVLWSFGDLADVAARLAHGLARAGVGPGDRVLVLERDPRRRYALVAGILWAGATVPAPPTSPSVRATLAAAVGTRPTAVAFQPRLWPLILGHPGLRGIPIRIVTQGPRLPGATSLAELARASAVPPLDVAGDVPALASFTTGSLGPPQLVLRSHDLLRAQHDALGRLRALTDDDRDLVGLPFLALHDLASGVTCVLPPPDRGGARSGARVCRAVARAGATSAAGFPHLFEAAAAAPRKASSATSGHPRRRQPRDRRAAGSLARRARADVTVVYGSTEAEPIAAIPAAEYPRRARRQRPTRRLRRTGGPGLDLRLAPPDRQDDDRAAPARSWSGRELRRPAQAAGWPPATPGGSPPTAGCGCSAGRRTG
jgi:acyl-CoA synthetase (AMP-forming)/AMP-acid ligase II